MLDWPNEGSGGCACIFERKEYCGVAEPIEWCAYHSKLRTANELLVRWKGEIDSRRIALGLPFPDDYDNSPKYAVATLIEAEKIAPNNEVRGAKPNG